MLPSADDYTARLFAWKNVRMTYECFKICPADEGRKKETTEECSLSLTFKSVHQTESLGLWQRT